jgi:hypothetical protein
MLSQLNTYAPLFVSVLALSTSIWSAYETREHDRLSLQPHVYYTRDFRPVSDTGAKQNVGLFMINGGMGSAEVVETRIYFDGIRVNNWSGVFSRVNLGKGIQGFVRPTAYYLMPGQKIDILSAAATAAVDMPGFQNLIYKRLFLISNICSVYEECRLVCSTVAPDEKCREEEAQLPK